MHFRMTMYNLVFYFILLGLGLQCDITCVCETVKLAILSFEGK